MDFSKKLWTKSFREWNFFYEMHEKLHFDKNLYNEFLENIILYAKNIKDDIYVDKDIMKNLYNCMNLVWWIERMYHENKIQVTWITIEELYDCNERMTIEIYNLLS